MIFAILPSAAFLQLFCLRKANAIANVNEDEQPMVKEREENGERRRENGEWRMENREWQCKGRNEYGCRVPKNLFSGGDGGGEIGGFQQSPEVSEEETKEQRDTKNS